MKGKILTIVIIWLVVAIAATATIAFVYKNKEIRIAEELVAKANSTKKEEVVIGDDGKVKDLEKKEASNALKNKEEILAELDKSIEAIIFDEE